MATGRIHLKNEIKKETKKDILTNIHVRKDKCKEIVQEKRESITSRNMKK